MAKARNGMTIFDKRGKVVAKLTFRRECTPEIWLPTGFTYIMNEEGPKTP